mmetsp:Transcript_11735/g.19076  ORF Transcript_11735/g.19076 Transcript_11735/m.19076 type:complete len:585 (+) Transcript_11735:120-1874(+)
MASSFGQNGARGAQLDNGARGKELQQQAAQPESFQQPAVSQAVPGAQAAQQGHQHVSNSRFSSDPQSARSGGYGGAGRDYYTKRDDRRDDRDNYRERDRDKDYVHERDRDSYRDRKRDRDYGRDRSGSRGGYDRGGDRERDGGPVNRYRYDGPSRSPQERSSSDYSRSDREREASWTPKPPIKEEQSHTPVPPEPTPDPSPVPPPVPPISIPPAFPQLPPQFPFPLSYPSPGTQQASTAPVMSPGAPQFPTTPMMSPFFMPMNGFSASQASLLSMPPGPFNPYFSYFPYPMPGLHNPNGYMPPPMNAMPPIPPPMSSMIPSAAFTPEPIATRSAPSTGPTTPVGAPYSQPTPSSASPSNAFSPPFPASSPASSLPTFGAVANSMSLPSWKPPDPIALKPPESSLEAPPPHTILPSLVSPTSSSTPTPPSLNPSSSLASLKPASPSSRGKSRWDDRPASQTGDLIKGPDALVKSVSGVPTKPVPSTIDAVTPRPASWRSLLPQVPIYNQCPPPAFLPGWTAAENAEKQLYRIKDEIRNLRLRDVDHKAAANDAILRYQLAQHKLRLVDDRLSVLQKAREQIEANP